MGHTRPEKHIAIGMYTVGIERFNEEELKWKLTKKNGRYVVDRECEHLNKKGTN